jgi:hypothetical protein
MIQKVSNQGSRLLGDDNSGRLERDSMNKSAMDSFSNIVIASAKGLIAKGESLEEVAAKFKIEPSFLKQMLEANGVNKIACACEPEQKTEDDVRWSRSQRDRIDRQPELKRDVRKKAAKTELTEEEIKAIEAYNALHNIKSAGTPTLPTNSSKRILTNKGNDVVDNGGARKQMGYERNNSIFDPNVIERQSKERTNDEILREAAQKRASDREDAKHTSRYETIDGDSIIDALKSVDQRKDAGVRSVGAQEAHKYDNKLPMNGISIFDTGDFDRVPEKTAGDKRRDEIKEAAKAPKDRSWVQTGSKSVTSSDIVNRFIDSLLNKKG